MSGALIRGGAGSEITLQHLLRQHGLSAAPVPRDRAEPLARAYEAQHPGSVVVCDWELIDDEDIAAMGEEDRARALADRQALADRRAASAVLPPIESPARGGDPDRQRELLRRAKNEISMLNPDESEPYKKRFGELMSQIHQLEDALEIPRTLYKLGKTVESPVSKLSQARRQELAEKVTGYRSLPTPNRAKSIKDVRDPVLAQLFFDAEPEQKLRDALAFRLVELGAVAAA